MKIIIKFSSEIIIKSRAVRIFFAKILTRNIRIILKRHYEAAVIKRYWDHIELRCVHNNYSNIFKILVNIPGIHHFILVQDSIIESLEDIYQQVLLTDYCVQLLGKTFCIRVKRHGKHTVTSQDIERYIGSKLCSKINHTCVNLTKPDIVIYLYIKNNHLLITIKRYSGLGGLPIGTQQESLSLISGGFDSTVASYMVIRRGCKLNYCFFNLIGNDKNDIEVYKVVYFLWNKFSYSHNVKLVSINFSGVVKEILAKVTSKYVGMVLKRMMIRAASSIAARWKIKALVTGEVLGQVSSQTLDNLVSINNVLPFNYIILRPLIVYDKESIIKLSRHIGTEIFSTVIPEYCGVISKQSSTKMSIRTVELEESNFNFLILDQAISQSYIIDVHKIPKIVINQNIFEIEIQTKLSSQDIILDIRTENEQRNNPISFPIYVKIKKIPFYRLIDQFPNLDQSKIYFLYCDRGIMSRLQAVHLHQKGFKNIKIYRPFIS